MKEIKAFIRKDRVNITVEALQNAGAPGISISEIHPVGYGYEPNYFESHYTDVVDSYRHLAIVKLEIVCTDRDAEKLLKVILRSCNSGKKGDGVIFVSEVGEAVRIRDGKNGEEVLQFSPGQ